MSRGFVLVEVSITFVVLSLALVALLPVFMLAIRAAKGTEHIEVASHLAAELMEEVRLRKWDSATPKPRRHVSKPGALGLETGEVASDKRTFDDIDDFAGWVESRPLDPLMRPLAAFPAYSRGVTVRYVDADLNPASGPTDYKQVTACAQAPKMKPLCLDTVLTNR